MTSHPCRDIRQARARLLWIRVTGWWPDLFAGVLCCLGFGSLVPLGITDVSMTAAVGAVVTYTWAVALAIAGGVLAWSIATRRYVLAGACTGSIAALLACNALAALLSRGPGFISGIVAYSLAAFYMSERAKQLAVKLPAAPRSYR